MRSVRLTVTAENPKIPLVFTYTTYIRGHYSSTYHSKVNSLQKWRIRVHWSDKMTRWQNICWFIDIYEIFLNPTTNFKAQIIVLKNKCNITHTWIWFFNINSLYIISKNINAWDLFKKTLKLFQYLKVTTWTWLILKH